MCLLTAPPQIGQLTIPNGMLSSASFASGIFLKTVRIVIETPKSNDITPHTIWIHPVHLQPVSFFFKKESVRLRAELPRESCRRVKD